MGGPYLARQSLSHLSPYRPLMDLLSLGLALEAHSHALPRTEDAQTTSKPEDLSWSQAKLWTEGRRVLPSFLNFHQKPAIWTVLQNPVLWDPSVALCAPPCHHSSSPVGCGPHTYCVPLMTAYPSSQVLFTLRDRK